MRRRSSRTNLIMHPEKATIVDDLQAKLNASPFLFVADYTGLKVGEFGELRNRLWEVGARCHVVKNTFLRPRRKMRVCRSLGELRGRPRSSLARKTSPRRPRC